MRMKVSVHTAGVARHPDHRSHPIPANLGRIAPPICPDLVSDRDRDGLRVTDHLVELPMRQSKKACNFAECIVRETSRSQHRVLEGYGQRGVLLSQSRLFLRWSVFG